MENTKNNEMESELLHIKLQLRKKERKLKKYNRALEAKQHVQDTLKRYHTTGESPGDTLTEATSSVSSESKCGSSKSVKFCEDSPEVIFVTPMPASSSNKMDNKTDRFKSKGYRSLSLHEKKIKEAAKLRNQVPSPEKARNEIKNSFYAASLTETETLTRKIESNNNEDKLKDIKDTSGKCGTDEKCPSTQSSSCSDLSDTDDKQNRLRVNYSESAENYVLSEPDLSEGIDLRKKVLLHRPSSQKQQIDVDSLNDWIADDPCSPKLGGNFTDAVAEIDRKVHKDEKCDLNTTINDSYEWEENDFIESLDIKDIDIETNVVGEKKESDSKKTPGKELESQDLFCSPLRSNNEGRGEPKVRPGSNDYACRNQSSRLQEKSLIKDDRQKENFGKEGQFGFDKKKFSVKKVDENGVDDGDVRIERRIRSKRHKHLSHGGSCSEDSNSGTVSKETSEESFTSRRDSKFGESCSDVHSKHETEVMVLLGRANCPYSTVKQDNDESMNNRDAEELSIETAETQLYHDGYHKSEIVAILDDKRTQNDSPVLKIDRSKTSPDCHKKDGSHAQVCTGEALSNVNVYDDSCSNSKAVHFNTLTKLSTDNMLINNESCCDIQEGKNKRVSKCSDVNGIRGIENHEDCNKGDNANEKLMSNKRVQYVSLRSHENFGKILTASLGHIVSENEISFYILLVHESGLSIWSTDKKGFPLDYKNLTSRSKCDKEGGIDGGQKGDWALVDEKSYQIGAASDIRGVVAMGLSFDEEVKYVLGIGRNGDSSIRVVYVQYDLKGDWSITDTHQDTLCCNEFSHLFGCVLSEWSVTLCWNSDKTYLESFLVIDLDVTYSRRRKKWELHCSPLKRSPEWCSHLTGLVSLHHEGIHGLTVCTSNKALYIYNVVEDTVISRLEWKLSSVSLALALKDLLFVMSYDSNLKKTHLSAINPITGDSETFYSWSVENDYSKSGRNSQKEGRLCDGSLQHGTLVAVYDNGVVAHLHL